MSDEREILWLQQKGAFGLERKSPLTANDANQLMLNPRSELYKKTFTAQLVQSLNIQGIQERIRELVDKIMQQIANFQSVRVAETEMDGLSADEFVKEIGFKQLHNAGNELNNVSANLPHLVAERDKFLDGLPKEWEEERNRQFDDLLQPLNTALNNMGLSSLDESEEKHLRGLHKAQELMLMKDSPVPEEALLSVAQDKEHVVKGIELSRIIAAKQQGVPFDDITSLKPSMIKAQQKGEIGKLMLKHKDNCKKSDGELMEKQMEKLQQYNKEIQKIEDLQQQVNDVSLAVKNNLQNPSTSIVDNLEQLYNLSVASGKKGSLLESDFEYKLTSMIKQMSPEERERFHQDCETGLNNTGLRDTQRQFLEKALTIDEEVPKQTLARPT